jgi:hypothetical protein
MLGRMTDKARLKIATAVTVAFIAAISFAGVSAHNSKPVGTKTMVAQPSAGGQAAGPSQATVTPWQEGEGHD